MALNRSSNFSCPVVNSVTELLLLNCIPFVLSCWTIEESELINHLARKAKEGVEIRAIFDGFGNASNNRPMRKKAFKRNQGKRH